MSQLLPRVRNYNVAVAEEDLLEILRWLDPEAGPLLIQGDRAFLEGLREAGSLPYPVPGSRSPQLAPS